MTKSTQHRLDPKTARHALTDHPHYRYRGCAPDPDDPAVAAGDLSLPVGSWDGPDTDGGEPQPVRIAREKAAKAVCGRCPVRAACLAYGSSVTRDGRLAEPYAILGGTTGLERHRALIRERQALPQTGGRQVPVRHLRTPQKLAVLRALARHTGAEEVAAAADRELRALRPGAGAGLDLRTVNWQRSILAGKLGLPHDATRAQLLEAAAGRGLLDGVEVVADDGSVPAVPPPVRGLPAQDAPTTARPAAARSVTAAGEGVRPGPDTTWHGLGPRRGRFGRIPGQLTLSLDLDTPTPPPPVPRRGHGSVTRLPARTNRLIGAAA